VENINILVVDDERKIRDLVRLYLEKEGFNVGEAEDGQKALDLYQQRQWNLIVLDLMMPGMDGWEVCKEVRRRKSDVPIIMLTGRDVTLTPKEYELLYQLARSPRRTFTRDELLKTIWGYDYIGDTRTVDTHVNRLRDKLLKASGNKSSYIATVWGVGYRLEVI